MHQHAEQAIYIFLIFSGKQRHEAGGEARDGKRDYKSDSFGFVRVFFLTTISHFKCYKMY